VSLLLDALKKAEEAKRQAAAGSESTASAAPTTAAAELSLEPVTAAPAPTSPLPDLSAHLASVDADLAAVPMTPPSRATGSSESASPRPSAPAPKAAQKPAPNVATEQEAVRNVFAAKRTPPPNRTPLWIALGIAGVAAVGIGIWFWFQLQSVGNSSMAAKPTPTPPAPAGPIAAPAPLTPPPVQASAPLPETASLEPSAATPAAAPPAQESRAERKTAPAEPEGPVRVTRGTLRVPPALTRAFEQLQADDLNGAVQSYEQVLRSDPKNVDALLGMAAIAVREGDSRTAESWYLKALEADPKDPNAQAGLINLRGQADPAAAESRLKLLLAQQPDSPTLNFALGNVYAGQRRWSEAQLAYFNAHTADPANPDYLFNLASSLDNLHLPKVAIDYYRSALAASNGRKPGFDVEQVKARIAELQR
jgi:Tfp pilus assembly protein PilF